MSNSNSTRTTVSTGLSFGSALAIVISWDLYHSVLWAIIHGVFSWFYVIYYLFTGAPVS